MKNRRSLTGFTLIEMLVVICIILILMALMGVLIKGVIDRSRYKDTTALVKSLKTGCECYMAEEKVYPPQTYGAYSGSQTLHFLLGRQATVKASQGAGGTVTKRDPYLNFQSKWLSGNPGSGYPNPPVQLIDAWTNVVEYYNPKPSATGTAPSYYIVSKGKDGAPGTGDEVTSDIGDD
ncbi:MAG: prepilin-type N-terminal cleavage/methylation domain-containing protein [Planctomycetes bacterium]|nr:prepilin-type N-terminal cleavage/methylation domain-containing protein [Planctomycetota bacterium]